MEGSFWVLLLALLLFATSLMMHRLVDGHLSVLRLPLTWFYASWLLGLLLLSMPLFEYFERFSLGSASYLIGVLLAFSIGSVAAAFWSRYADRKGQTANSDDGQPNEKPLSIRFVVILLILGGIGSTLLMVNSILAGGLSLTERLDSENFAAIRSAHMEGSESRIGLLYGPATIMSAIGGLGVGIAFYLLGAGVLTAGRRRSVINLAVVVLLINAVIGFIGFGSRMFSLFAVIVAMLGFAEGRWAVGGRVLFRRMSWQAFTVAMLMIVLSAAALWVSATVFLEKRVQEQSPQTLLFRTHRANFSPLVLDLTRKDTALQYFMFSLSYATTPIPTLAFYLDLPDARLPGPFYGEYNFPAIARWTRRLTFMGDPYAWEKARYEIFKPLGDIRFGMNVWSTAVRDLIADFGKLGALVFVGLVGFGVHRLFVYQRLRPGPRKAGLLIYMRLLLGFAGLISVLFQPHIHWPMYLAIVLVVLSSPKKRRTSTFAPTHSKVLRA